MNGPDRFSALTRKERLQEMARAELDLLVIGGGVTGAGIALDAQVRGLRTGLVEMQDFAAGTSSRSTKLIHGGLRYLKQLEFGLVAEVGRERAIVYENAPHVTTPVWMLLPIIEGGDVRQAGDIIRVACVRYVGRGEKKRTPADAESGRNASHGTAAPARPVKRGRLLCGIPHR